MNDVFRNTFSFNFVVAVDRAGVAPPGYGRVKALASLFNVSTTTIQKWLTGESLPEMGRLTEICEKLDCTLDDLIIGPQRIKLVAPQEDVTRISLLSNSGHVFATMPNALLSSAYPFSEQCLFRVDDDMMLNHVSTGELLLFSKALNAPISGRVFVFFGGGRLFIRRLQMMGNGAFMMLCDNPLFPPESIDTSTLLPLPENTSKPEVSFDFDLCDPGCIYLVGGAIGRLIYR